MDETHSGVRNRKQKASTGQRAGMGLGATAQPTLAYVTSSVTFATLR
jgi:hypothetical protein